MAVEPTTARPVEHVEHRDPVVTDTVVREPAPVVVGGGSPTFPRSVSWGAIIAGSLIALGLTILLSLLGVGIGLAVSDPAEPGGANLASVGIGTIVWIVLTQLAALFVGGYAAARLSANMDAQKTMLHGATVWALATLFLVYLATSGVSSLVSTAYSGIQSAGSALSSATKALVPEDVDLPSFTAPDVALESLPPRVQNALRQQGITAQNLRAEARAAFNEVVSQRERNQAADVATDVARDIASSPTDAIADIEAGLDRLVGQGGVFSEEDRREFVEVTERRFGISAQDAETLVARWETQAKEAAAGAQQAVAEAREQAVQAAQTATEAVSSAAFWAAIVSLLGLIAAVTGGIAGRRKVPEDEEYGAIRRT